MQQTKQKHKPKRRASLAAAMALALAAALALTGCAAPQASVAASQAPAPSVTGTSETAATAEFGAFTAQDINGNEVTQDIFAGKKLTMVNVWGTFCGPCLHEMPELGAIAEEYKDGDVQLVGVVLDAVDGKGNAVADTVSQAVALAKQTGAGYTHLVPSADLLQTRIGNVTAVPTTFFVNAKGEVVGEDYLGAADGDTWRQRIQDTLAKLQ